MQNLKETRLGMGDVCCLDSERFHILLLSQKKISFKMKINYIQMENNNSYYGL